MAKGWGLYKEDGNVYQIIPEGDLEPHSHDLLFPLEPTEWFRGNLENGILIIDKYIEFTSSCKCEPKIKWINESSTWQVVHNSFDGREIIEWANELLSTS